MDPTQTDPRPSRETPAERLGLGEYAPGLREFQDRLDRTAAQTWARLRDSGQLRDTAADPPTLEQPFAFAELFAAALAIERSEDTPESRAREEVMLRHHLEWMPALRVELLATTDDPQSALFHTSLDPSRLPRLVSAFARFIDLLKGADIDPTDTLGASSADALFKLRPSLAELYAPTYFGGCMPMLYASPVDLDAYQHELNATEHDVHTLIDHRLTAPLLHEHLHLARPRQPLLPHYMDECLAGYLGVLILDDFAWPEPGQDNALFGSPWFAQVGESLCRAVGLRPVLRAHAGKIPWSDALPGGLEIAAERIGWEQYRTGREPHLLTGNTQPEPWIKLFYLAASGRDVSTITLGDLAALSASEIPAPDPTPEDTQILTHALKTMCLRHHLAGHAHRITSMAPPEPIIIDLEQGRVHLANQTSGPLQVPTYAFPLALAAPLREAGARGLQLTLNHLDAIPSVVADLEASRIQTSGPGYTLNPTVDP